MVPSLFSFCLSSLTIIVETFHCTFLSLVLFLPCYRYHLKHAWEKWIRTSRVIGLYEILRASPIIPRGSGRLGDQKLTQTFSAGVSKLPRLQNQGYNLANRFAPNFERHSF